MEAKDTTMNDQQVLDFYYKNRKKDISEKALLEAQAELSFKAGYEQRKGEVEMATVSLADMLREQRQAGRREVVEWIGKSGSAFRDGKEWRAKLKEWNLRDR